MKNTLSLSLIFLAFLFYASTFASTTPAREVAHAWAKHYLETQKLETASTHLRGHLKQDPEDAEGHYLLGITHRLMSNWQKAEDALGSAARLQTGVDRGATLYLLADTQIRSGNVSKAILTLEEVAKVPGLRNSAKKAAQGAEVGEPLPPLDLDRSEASGSEYRSPWRSSLSVATGYDSNVLLLPDSQTAGLNPSTTMVTTGLQVGYSDKLFDQDFGLDLSASYSRNLTEAAVTFDNIPVNLGAEWRLPGKWNRKREAVLMPSVSTTFVNTAGMTLFSTSAGMGYKFNVLNSGGHLVDFALPLTHNWYPGVVVTSTADDRTGFSVAPGLSHQHGLLGFTATQALSYTHQFAKGQNFVSSNFNAQATLAREIGMDVAATLSASASKTSYPQNTTGRSETRYNLGVDFARSFKAFVPLRGSLSYGMENNSSTIEAASYFKHSAILKVNYEIQ